MNTEICESLRLVDPRPKHLEYLSKGLRQIDRKELAAVSDGDTFSDLVYSASVSKPCWVLVKDSDCGENGGVLGDDEPVAIGGVAPNFDQPDLGVPWFLATDKIKLDCVRCWLAHHSRALIDEIQSKFPRLENYISAENETTIRWLTWLGFELGPPEPLGRNGEMLRRIYRERK